MSVENPENQGAQENEHQKLVNGEQPQQNGFSNGHSSDGIFLKPKDKSSSHKSSSKDKHRDKDRDKERSKDRSSSSSGHRDKEKSSSHKSHSHDKDRKSSSSSSKDKDRSSSSHSSSHKSSSKDKHRDKDRKEGEKSSSSSSANKEHKPSSSSSSSHKSSSKDKHRDKERSSGDKKDKERSGDKTTTSSSRDKDGNKKEHKSSSSSSSKHRSSSDHKHSSSSHKSSNKDKEHRTSSSSSHKSSSKDKHRSGEKKERENGHEVKQEITSPTKKQYELQMETMQQACHVQLERVNFDDLHGNNPVMDPLDMQNVSQASSCDYNFAQFRTDEENFVVKEEASESEEEKPLNMRGKAAVKQYDEGSEGEMPLSKRRKPVVSDSEEDVKPLSMKKKVKPEVGSDEEEIPLAARKKPKAEKKRKKKKPESDDEEESFDEKPKKRKVKKEKPRESAPVTPQKGGRKKKDDETEEVWKWWEEEKRDDNMKWHYLEHKGPLFAPEYEPLPKHVKFEYDGKPIKLSQDAEEIAGFYGKMLESDYCEKKVFNDNFFGDWRKSMTKQEREIIRDFKKCNFKYMLAFFKEQSEKNKQRTKEEKLALKQKNEEIMKEYGVCIIDNHKEKIGNFRIEPPGLFRGRGEHPKMGMLKKRVMPEDVIINCSKDSKFPSAPKGHRWKEVRHDNTVTWLASWIENVQGQGKYVMLNPSSKLKGEKDWQKYETARRLFKHIDKIRSTYRDEWKSKEMRIRQRAVAMYFIDKLALRAGNEKDEDQADTVGCCSLRVEHVDLFKEKDGKENVVVFDFLGKDSIRYYNEVEVEKRVFKNLELFKENKKDGDDLFDRLNTSVLNEHLRDLMEGLTAKVFRTFNASYTLQKQLQELTDPDATVPEKLLAYNRANRAVAILCNHQRSVPKTHQKSMETLKEKIRLKREAVDDCEQEYKDLKRGNPALREKKKKQLERLKEQLQKLELQETDRDENKTIALGTSKLNYLDPRISVAWCKKHEVPIEKIFNKTQRDKFRWAIDMADENYVF